jgi:hypothetical protein
MLAEYKVNLVCEVTTTVTLVAENEEDAFDSAYNQLLDEVQDKLMIETIDIVDYELKKHENKIH